ncbi:hypothetical protein PV11_04576 [Exophiala sideris]|uniref:Uncharacterized protein n=1 Tax=Exophiala sideris TaxID=1016849 RepID=A0A0D1W164_9EURO|nr:hypothetical protein PV11_04576 [Exophiala sideris]
MARGPLKRRQIHRNAPTPIHGRKVPNSSPAKLELEKKLAHKPVGQRPVDSDDSDRLVVKGNGRRGRNVAPQEIYASGAVASGDKPGAYPSRAQTRKNMARDTKEILASTQQNVQKDAASGPPTTKQPLREVNGVRSGKQDKAAAATSVSEPAVKPLAGLARSSQPDPSRETSVLGTLKPRRRQPSILQDLGQDSSTLDLEDEENFLPDDISTPFTISKAPNPLTTPATKSSHTSSSKKRKFGSRDPFQPGADEGGHKRTASPTTTVISQKGTPQPSLPLMLVTDLRESGRKHREHADEDDILAPPESSPLPSSPPAMTHSPADTRRPKKMTKPLAAIKTDALRAQMMPTKRRRTARERSQPLGKFDIPADPNSELSHEPSEPDDESSFLPTKKGRRAKRKEPLVRAANARTTGVARVTKGGVNAKRGVSASATSKSQSSTRRLITTTKPVLTPSTSTSVRKSRKTKSPSQLSTVEVSTSRPNPHEERDESQQKRYGGSRRRRQDMDEGPDKENLGLEAGSSDDSGIEGRNAGQRRHIALDKNPDVVPEVEIAATISKNKWADIDAWDMDFEEVEVMTGSGSSSPMRR